MLNSPGARETRKIKFDNFRDSSFCQVYILEPDNKRLSSNGLDIHFKSDTKFISSLTF